MHYETMNSNSKKIVAIDNDHLMLDVIKIILEEYDYEVNTHDSPEKALERIINHPPDMILLDLAMPQISGVEVLKRLRKAGLLDKIPVVLISASDNVKEVADKFELNAYIQKPFGVNELYKTVNNNIHN